MSKAKGNMKPTHIQQRQGDLLIEVISKLPKEVKSLESRVLAYGEVTGHSHRATGAGVLCFQSTEDSTTYVQTGSAGGTIVHDEHDQHPLSPDKIYRVRRQREFDPIEEVTRQVVD